MWQQQQQWPRRPSSVVARLLLSSSPVLLPHTQLGQHGDALSTTPADNYLPIFLSSPAQLFCRTFHARSQLQQFVIHTASLPICRGSVVHRRCAFACRHHHRRRRHPRRRRRRCRHRCLVPGPGGHGHAITMASFYTALKDHRLLVFHLPPDERARLSSSSLALHPISTVCSERTDSFFHF